MSVVTDNAQTLANALDRIKVLESLLARASCMMGTDDVDFDELSELKKEIEAITPCKAPPMS